MGAMTHDGRPRHLRLIIEADDLDDALRFYRDVLGLPEQLAFAAGGDDRVAILPVESASIELATPAHARAIDRLEGMGPDTAPALRLALEVPDAAHAVGASQQDGRTTLAPLRQTPFRTLAARVEGPAGWQVTLYQELDDLTERATRPGFAWDGEREGLEPDAT